jgi:hypothetical protein
VTYSVNIFGSHPEEGNDDCHTGAEFPTIGPALAVFENLEEHFRPAAIFSWGPHYFVELLEGSRNGEDYHIVRRISVREVGTKPERDSSDDDDWRREQAMEAGMLHGIDAYNDAMGFELGDE